MSVQQNHFDSLKKIGFERDKKAEAGMLAKERQNKILEILYEKKIIKIAEIVHMFDVSNETARRDLESVQDLGIAKRVYGGAVLIDENNGKIQVGAGNNWGLQHGRAERDAIGKKAAEFIHEGDSICLGVGTTVHEIAKHISGKKDVTVITNSIAVLTELADSDNTLYILGGLVDMNERTMKGEIAENSLQMFYVDKAFIGAGGITFDGGVTDYDIQESTLKNKICEHAGKVFLVAHSAKFGLNAFSFSCPLSLVNVIITDPMLPEAYAEKIREMGIELVFADIPAEE